MGALNVAQRFGLKPVRYLNGSPWNGACTKCYVSASYGTALFIGDPVDLDTTLVNKDPLAKHPTVIKTTLADGNYAIGSIVAFEPNRDNLSRIYLPASTGGYCYVATDPNIVFHIRGEPTTTPTYVMAGQNALMVQTAAGSTVTGLSGIAIDMGVGTAPSADASNMLMILGLANMDGNDLAINAIWEVVISMHRWARVGGLLGLTSA